MKMLFSKKSVTRSNTLINDSTKILNTDNSVNLQSVNGTRYKYDMISVANSGKKCSFCNR
jgi:hypothetical protein